MDLLHTLKENHYDIVALQEPHIDFLGRTWANPCWTVIYPIGKGREWLRQSKRLAKTSEGVSSQQLRRLYLAVVVPRMLYGADVFLGPALRCESFKDRKGGCATLGKLAAIQRSVALMIVGGLCTLPNNLLDMHANMLLFHLLVNKVQYQVALRLATLPSTHLLHKLVNQAASRFVKRHHSPLHELMFKFRLKPKLLEKNISYETSCKLGARCSHKDSREQRNSQEQRLGRHVTHKGVHGRIRY